MAAIIWLLNKPFTVTDIASSYAYQDFIETQFSTTCDKAIWTANGIDFYQGKEPKYIPIQAEDNDITVACGEEQKAYHTYISMEDALILTDYKIDPQLLDYDGDALSNQYEQENGLATYTDDTDGDGLKDNVELAMGLDPKQPDDANAEREFTVSADYDQSSNVSLSVKGAGNIANTFLDTVNTQLFGSSGFVASNVVEISTTNDKAPSSLTLAFKGNYTNAHAVYAINPTTYELTELSSEKISAAPSDATFAATSSSVTLTARAGGYDAYYFVGKKAEKPSTDPTHQIGIVLDNSGSMYSCEDFLRIAKSTSKDCANNDVNNDPSFKRVDLMTNLIDQLSIENVEYSVSAFTNSYCLLQDWTSDKSVAKTAVESIKNSCQNFNGTNVQDSADKMAGSVDEKLWGTKHVIVLTDGKETSGLFSYVVGLSNSELEKYQKQGIKITTICLGECDTEMLQRLATKTGGKYLLASSADSLSSLLALIKSDIDNSFVTEDVSGDGTPDLLIADSGFRAEVDGFHFSNYATKQQPGGSCLGISIMTRDIYLGTFRYEYTEADFEGGGWSNITVTDNNKQRLTKGSVYSSTDIKEAYKIGATLKYPDDYRVLSDGIPSLNPKYKSGLIDAGFQPYIKEAETEFDGVRYDKYEIAGSLDLMEANVSPDYVDDYQLLQLATMQYNLKTVTVAADDYVEFFQHLINTLTEANTVISSSDLQSSTTKLTTGTPLIVFMSSPTGGHAIIGETIYADLEKDVYHMTLYDNNFPGEEQHATFTRNVFISTGVGSTLSSTYNFHYAHDKSYTFNFALLQ
ncbi:MAG: VWA domain-containing protein [Candidatus Nomurabacteria bacterium]|nr:VWA domain-containing protein [Candidatus Nomurabacteria bacterium]